MQNIINHAELAATSLALKECQSHQDEYTTATNCRSSMHKISKHWHSPHQTEDDRHQPMLEAIAVGRAQPGRLTTVMKVTLHIGIHGNEMDGGLPMKRQRSAQKQISLTVMYHKHSPTISKTSFGCNRKPKSLSPAAHRANWNVSETCMINSTGTFVRNIS